MSEASSVVKWDKEPAEIQCHNVEAALHTEFKACLHLSSTWSLAASTSAFYTTYTDHPRRSTATINLPKTSIIRIIYMTATPFYELISAVDMNTRSLSFPPQFSPYSQLRISYPSVPSLLDSLIQMRSLEYQRCPLMLSHPISHTHVLYQRMSKNRVVELPGVEGFWGAENDGMERYDR